MPYTVDLTNTTSLNRLTETRQSLFLKRYNMYHDDYKPQVNSRLTEIYTKASELRMDKQMNMTNNVFKTIVNKESRVYKNGITREFSDEYMALIYTEARIDKYMNQANRYMNAFNDIIMQVSWDEDIPRFTFRYPHKTRVEVDDFGDPLEVEYFVEMVEEYEKWAFWSDTEHYYKIYSKIDEFEIEPIEGNEEMVNPYGVLPFVFMQNGFRDVGFFDIFTGNDMVEVTLDMAVYNTFKNYMIKWQSFKQLLATGNRIGSISGQMLDPSTPITAEGEDVRIDVLDLQANLKELGEAIDSQMVNVAINHNISPNQFRMTGEVSSGFALKMENENLDTFVLLQQQDFAGYEKDLHDLIITIGNIHGNSFSEDVDFTAVFPPITYSESPESTLNSQEKAISLGLTNSVQILEDTKDITEEEAILEFNNNLALRNKMNEQVTAPTLNEASTAQTMGLTEDK